MIKCQGKDNIGPDFSGMQCAVKPPEFYRMISMEETVQVQKVITAVMIMRVPVTGITLIPDILKLFERYWFYLVNPLYQIGIHLFAVPHPFRCNLQGLIEQVIAAGDDIDEVADASGRVFVSVQMDMDAAGVIAKSSGLP